MGFKWYRLESKGTFDLASVGHLLFGLTTSCWIVFLFSSQIFFPIFYYITPIVFISWELLEHLVFKKYIYPKMFDFTWGGETVKNSIMDVILATIASSIYYGFNYLMKFHFIANIVGLFIFNAMSIFIGWVLYKDYKI